MKKLKFLILFLGFAGLLTLHACKEELPCNDPTNPNCPNYDPCYGKKPVTADFEMSQGWRSAPPKHLDRWNPDVAFGRGLVGFKPIGYDAEDTTVKYTWILGAETIYEYSFERDFIDTKEKEIPITLIVEKQPNLDCYPEDDGKDTLTQMIRLVDSPCEFLTNGDFKVLFEGEQDSAIVKVRNWDVRSKGYIRDTSCEKTNGAYFIGFNRDSLQPDTNWIGADYQFNSKIVFYPVIEGGGGTTNGIRGGYFKVNPATLKCESEYQFYLGGIGENTLYSRQFKFNGRKIR